MVIIIEDNHNTQANHTELLPPCNGSDDGNYDNQNPQPVSPSFHDDDLNDDEDPSDDHDPSDHSNHHSNDNLNDDNNGRNNKRKRNSRKQKPKKKKNTIFDIDPAKFFMRHQASDPIILECIKPQCVKLVEEAIRLNVCVDPTSSVFEHLMPLDITNTSGLYAMVDELGNVEKIGSTTTFRERNNDYDLSKCSFRKILDLDGVSQEFNCVMEEAYTIIMKMLIEHQDLHTFQRSIYKVLVESGGGALGPKRNIFLQTLELGFQYHCRVTEKVEFVMFEKSKLQALYDQVGGDDLTVVLEALSFLPVGAANRYVRSKCSWKPGDDEKRHSSKIMATECFLSKSNADKWSDTLPFPRHPNPKSAEEIFSSDYSPKQRKNGRKNLGESVNDLLAQPSGLLYIDTNRVLFEEDAHSEHKSVHEFLTKTFDIELRLEFRDEIWVYKCCTDKHGILVHRPLCMASDSQEFISKEIRLIRGITVAILCNLERHFNEEPKLSENDELANPVRAICYFQYAMAAFHGNLRQAAAFYRDAVKLDTFVYPLMEINLGKTPNGHLPRGLREHDRSESRPPPNRLGKDDHRIVQKARAFFCNHDLLRNHEVEEDAAPNVPAVFAQLTEILRSDKGKDGDNLKKRFDSLLLEFRQDSFHVNQLATLWTEHQSNRGNKTIGPGKAVTQLRILENNEEIQEFLDDIGAPTEDVTLSDSFWVRTGNHHRELNQIRCAETGASGWTMEDCPGNHLVLCNFTSEGLKTRFRQKNNRKGETHQSRAVQFQNFGIVKQKRIGRHDSVTHTLVKIAINNSNKGHTAKDKESNEREIDDMIRTRSHDSNPFWVKVNAEVDVEAKNIDNAVKGKRRWKVVEVANFPGVYPILSCYYSNTVGDLFKKTKLDKIKDASRKRLRSRLGVQKDKRIGFDECENPHTLMHFVKRP